MEIARWMALSPLLVTVAAGTLVTGVGPAVGGTAAWDPPPCAEAEAPPGADAWYRLDPVLDRTGTLAGRRLALGVAGDPERVLGLAPESFTSGPVGGLVVVGEDDGSASRLRLVDPARGCATAVGAEADVIRSAVLAPGAASLFEHRVDRTTRTDLGVWRRDLDVPGRPERVLEGLAPDARLGPTFTTDLVAAPDGRLVVSSCAPGGCRVRVLDPVSGLVEQIRDTGPAIGVIGSSLVVRAACAGWPCPVDAIDLASGHRRRLAAEAGAASLAGDRLVLETRSGSLRVVELACGRTLMEVAAAGIPMRAGSTATAGAAASEGWVPLARAGRPDGRTLHRLDPATGRIRSSSEDAR